MSTVTELNEPVPTLTVKAMYKSSSTGDGDEPFSFKKWLICNGMNAGRWTLFFGAPCISDTVDTDSIRIANQTLECTVVEFSLNPVRT